MKSVLIIDDDNIFNFLAKKQLESTGLVSTVKIALNGEEGLALLKTYYSERFLPDIILVDINMPVMNGFEFLQELEEIHLSGKENIKIFILTSSQDKNDISRAVGFNIVEYLIKPLSNDILKKVLMM